uniref:Cytochrome c oxidase subunit VIa n=1 Tax=Ajellomyces capsulatus TaxID=5037 RepID=A4URR3_AJECA|nr:cytochrome c oxidase subunit VIa [Histoplasma capsulatum]
MFPRASVFRLAHRTGVPATRSSPVRSGVLQRRFNSTEQKLPPLPDNAFNRERAAVKAHAAATSDLWRKLSIYSLSDAVVPVVLLASINAYNLWNEHWEHWEHMPPLEERVEYPYQNIRNKNYPWGDGDKVCPCHIWALTYVVYI